MSDAQTQSVYARVRPFRIAYLIDPDNCPPDQLDAIIGASYHVWGGRCHPIVPVQQGKIPEGYWHLLTFSDPDIIYTYVNLPPSLVEQIDRTICPLQLRAHPAHAFAETPPFYRPYDVVHHLVGCEAWIPDMLTHQSFPVPAKVLISRAIGDWPGRQFVLRNFGVLEEMPPLQRYSEVGRAVLLHPDYTDAQVLRAISAERGRVIFPHELAAYWANLDEPDHASHEYGLVLGQDVWTALFAWNRAMCVEIYLREGWHTMSLPPARLEDQEFREAVKAFLGRHVLRFGNSPPRVHVWYSAGSVDSETTARRMAQSVLVGVDCITEVSMLSPGEFPILTAYRDRFTSFEQVSWRPYEKPPVFQFQGSGRSFLVNVPAGTAEATIGNKMLDLKIEYQPPAPASLNQRSWWRLPKVLGLAHLFGRIGRITTDGVLSLVLGNEAAVEVRIPSPKTALRHALAGFRTAPYTDDLRQKMSPPFQDVRDSDKGQYNHGIARLIGSEVKAGGFFQHHYWREIVELLCRRSPKHETDTLESIKRLLRGEQPLIHQAAEGDEVAIDALVQYILTVARRERRVREINQDTLLSRFMQERSAFIKAHPNEGFTCLKRDARNELRSVLQHLTELEILLQGIRVQCEHCGSTFWYSAEAIAPRMRCDGCRAPIALPVEAAWWYRLNSLIRNGVTAHGSIPVLSALADLTRRARSFFVADAGTVLYEVYGGDPTVELDLAGILDGRVFIGEAKGEAREFLERRLMQLADAAKRLRVQFVVITAFRNEGHLLPQHEQTLRALLDGSGIDLEILSPHPRCFEPEYYLTWLG